MSKGPWRVFVAWHNPFYDGSFYGRVCLGIDLNPDHDENAITLEVLGLCVVIQTCWWELAGDKKK